METSTKNFNMEMNIVKALGIIAIVAGHADFSILTVLFPAYSYHLMVFFFVAGYFLKYENFENIFEFVKKKSKTLLLLYFIYNAVYAGITYATYKITGQIVGQLPTIKNFFFQPFFNGHQYYLDCALWFVPQLFISLVAFVLIYKVLNSLIKNNKILCLIFLLLCIGSIIFSSKFNQSFALMMTRTAFSMFFIYLGFTYKTNIEKNYSTEIFSVKYLPTIIAIQTFCWLVPSHVYDRFSTPLDYIVVWGYFPNIITPIITSITGIWMIVFIAKLITPYVKNNSFLDIVGKNTFHIMANHLLCFYIISVILLKLHNLPLDTMIESGYVYYKYDQTIFAFFYALIALLVTTYLAIILKWIKYKLFNH